MIVTKTPFRVSLFGGGSDLEAFYSKSPGAVLSFSINKYMYLSSHQFFEQDKYRLKYSKTETVDQIDQIQHPIFREVLGMLKISSGVEISSIADIPAGTGMGSSSSFTVGLLHNLSTRKNLFRDKNQLAEMACDIEINKLKEPIGKQDQYAASFGGINIIKFHSFGGVSVESLNLSRAVIENLQNHLILFYTGVVRSASEVLMDQRQNLSQEEKFKNLQNMVSLVDEGKNNILEENYLGLGKTLDHGWQLKKKLSAKIANSQIDDIYELAMRSGAWGGKLLGAGGGGFLLFVVPPEKRKQLTETIKLRPFSFQIEFDGSKVIYYEDETL